MTDYENTKETKIDHSHFKVSMVHQHRYLHTQYTTHLRQYVHVTICNHHHRFTTELRIVRQHKMRACIHKTVHL